MMSADIISQYTLEIFTVGAIFGFNICLLLMFLIANKTIKQKKRRQDGSGRNGL